MDTDTSYSENRPRPAVLSLAIRDKATLYAAYMPFLQGGGLFIPTPKQYTMGDAVFVLLQIMDNPKKFSIASKVVWITPDGLAQKQAGVGVSIPYDEGGNELREVIVNILGSAVGSSRKTFTL
jgi:type IV pilus assembly protein PilZ